MGNLDDPLNTFWQLVFRPVGTALWSLVTPRGVASNGGLVLADGNPASLTVGFEPSNNLLFSPVAQSLDQGQTWSPGLVPAALAPEPDALAASSTGALLALVAGGGGRVLHSGGDPSMWTKVTDRGALASSDAGRSCGVASLAAVGFQPGGEAVVGTTCTEPGLVGIFVQKGSAWHLGGPRLRETLASRPTGVVRLAGTASGLAGLIVSGTGTGAALIGMWEAHGDGQWELSSAFHLPSGVALLSSGFTPAGGIVVLTGHRGSGASLELLGGPGSGWRPLPPPPVGTATVAVAPDGSIDVLAVRSTTLTVWHLDTTAGAWDKTQTMEVPIQFGSSA
jgi:hypothetical protein